MKLDKTKLKQIISEEIEVFKNKKRSEYILENLGLNEGKKSDPKAKVRNKPNPVFDANNPKVKDNKDHFPLGDEDQARNALARASQYKKVPDWYDGDLESLVKKVQSAVKKAFPNIETTEKSANPGKG
jgi:hypothetical protein